MSRHTSVVVLIVTFVVFALGMADALVNPDCQLIPQQVMSIAGVILSGVTIGIILAGIKGGEEAG